MTTTDGTAAATDEGALAQRLLLHRALARREPELLQVRFRAEVIDRYRRRGGVQLLRTRSVGRVVVPGVWSLDVGISPDGTEVHVPVQDLLDRLPAEERDHWLEHMVPQPLSANFLKMRMAGSACIDDGEPAAW